MFPIIASHKKGEGFFCDTGRTLIEHTQGTILSSGGGTVKFVADPGYRENFADSGFFSTTAPAFVYGSAYEYTVHRATATVGK